MKNILYILFITAFLVSCTRIPSGSIGIVSNWSKEVRPTPALQGVEMTIFDSVDHIVDITETRVPILGEMPKDKDKIKLHQVDTVVTYKMVVDQCIPFFLQTKEVDVVDGSTVLGFDIVKGEAINSIREAFNLITSNDAITQNSKTESLVKEMLQKKLDSRYPGVFKIVNVNVNKVLLDPSIEKMMQEQAGVQNQKALIELKEAIVQKQNDLLKLEMTGVKKAAEAMGITSDKLLEFQAKMDFNKALRELATRDGKDVDVQIQVPK